jgi:hypothetical protein
MGILSGLRGPTRDDAAATGDPVVESVVRDLMRRSERLPETYLARFLTGDFEAPVPPAGAARESWMRENVARAFDPSRSPDVVAAFARRAPALGQAVEASVRDGAARWFEKASNGTLMGRDLSAMVGTVRAYTANRVVDFLKPGRRLAMRASREAASLRKAKDETVLERLAAAPQSRLDPLPPSGRERTDWIRERLLAEYVSTRAGVLSAEAVVEAAQRPRGPVPAHPLEDMPTVREDERAAVRGRVRDEMQREAGMSDPVLRSRHSGLPGVDGMEIPPSGRPRTQAIGRILMAEFVRGEMKRQGMIAPPKEERPAPEEASSMVRYAPRSRGLGRIEREVVDTRPPPAPKPVEKAVVPNGGDRPTASTRYAEMVRRAVDRGRHDF